MVKIQNDILNWLIFTVGPFLIGVATLYYKVDNTKRDQEKRLTSLEKDVEDNTRDIKDHKDEFKLIRSELKILSKVESQNDMIYDIVKELKEEMRNKEMRR